MNQDFLYIYIIEGTRAIGYNIREGSRAKPKQNIYPISRNSTHFHLLFLSNFLLLFDFKKRLYRLKKMVKGLKAYDQVSDRIWGEAQAKDFES